MTFQSDATVVLVHGAWADGSSWNRIILPLEQAGLNVMAAPIPLTSLSDDAAALDRALARTKGPILLAAHAYAGAVIAAVNDERVKGLVYVAALAPDEGETVAQVFYRDQPHAMAPKLAPDTSGFIWMPDDGFANAFAHHATAEQIALAKAGQRPISVNCIQEPATQASLEEQAGLVFDCRRRPDDQSQDAALHGGADESNRQICRSGSHANTDSPK